MLHPVRWSLLGLTLVAGCERAEPIPPPQPPPVTPAVSAWHASDESAQVAVAADDPHLAAAIGRARSTAGQARDRWRAADAHDRARWAVKWAAPTADGGVEHVWVRPVVWTRFRIEGRLANPPTEPLESGRLAGELVSFPAEQLSDWVHLVEGPGDGPREGGFTMDLLEQRYGPP